MAPDRPINVLLINRALPAHVPGGLERHVADLALGLAGAGHRVHLLAAPLPPEARAPFEAAGIRLHPADCAHPRHYTLRYLRQIGARIETILQQNSIDVIHAQEFGLGCWRPPAGGPPLVLTVHGTITSETPLHPDVYMRLSVLGRLNAWRRFGRRLAYGPVWRGALAAAGAILVDSTFSQAELLRLAPECGQRIHFISLGAREDGPPPPAYLEARASLGWRGPQLLTTGRLEWQKGHELALAALATLRHREWHYTIAGTGLYASRLRRIIENLGLGDRVTLAGWVDEETRLGMLAGADLFLWPERTHPAFGLAGLEALLAGTPVLAVRRGAIPEVMGETEVEAAQEADGVDHGAEEISRVAGGWLIPPHDARALAQALKPLLANPATLTVARSGLRAAALARFNFARMVESVQVVYQSLTR